MENNNLILPTEKLVVEESPGIFMVTRDLPYEGLPASCGAGVAETFSKSLQNKRSKRTGGVGGGGAGGPMYYVQLSKAQLEQIIETKLNEKIRKGDKQAVFILGQFYFEEKNYAMARSYFQRAYQENGDIQALFQLGVLHYDGLGVETNLNKGVECMTIIASAKDIPDHLLSLYYAAHYNIGRAHFQGHGAARDEEKSLKHWMIATANGSPRGSVLAQTALGYFYSTETTIGQPDLKKAFFWHTEACGNGSIESQGALGVMYLHGIGVKQNWEIAFNTLSEAGRRGNIYAQGNLCFFYYNRKMFTKCSHLALKLMSLKSSDLTLVARETHCVLSYVYRGLSMAAFLLARCMQRGLGVEQNIIMSKSFFTTSFELDYDLCSRFQNLVNLHLL